MVQAKTDPTRIEWWTLDDLLEYLTLAPFCYEIDEALRKMERAFSTGDLALYFETDVIDGKLQTYEFDPFRFRTGQTLKFDYFSQLVRVVPRRGVRWGRRDYKLIKQDALRVWPLPAPAPQTAPRQPEAKTGPDLVEAKAAERPSALPRSDPPKRVSTKKWFVTRLSD